MSLYLLGYGQQRRGRTDTSCEAFKQGKNGENLTFGGDININGHKFDVDSSTSAENMRIGVINLKNKTLHYSKEIKEN